MKTNTLIGAVLLGLAAPSAAYEQPTHQEVSLRAVRNSVLERDPDLLSSLSLSATATYRGPDNIERPIGRLIERGAGLEDDESRPRNHFFDPFFNRAIALPPGWVESPQFGETSPDWILTGEGQSDDDHFSYLSALSKFVDAMSLATLPERNAAWGRFFQTLGHVIHHIQDMAQPQHVRNDPHYINEFMSTNFETLRLPFFEDRSWFEQYAVERRDRVTSRLPEGRSPVRFTRAREFWTTTDGRGIADYTNANFVSKDTNFEIRDGALAPSNDYPAPVPGERRTWPLDAPELNIANADDLCARLRAYQVSNRHPIGRCEIDTIESVIFDEYRHEVARNDRASSISVFDEALREVGGPRGLMVLNSVNIDAAYSFLIPQAAHYSAGLIDHFFRGRLEPGEVHAQDGVLTIEVKNISAEGNAFGPGTFQLYYDSPSGQRKALQLQAGANVGMQQFAPGQKHILTTHIPGDVDLNVDKPFVVVYSGIVGAEEAVAGLVLAAPQLYQGFLFRVNGTLPGSVGSERLLYFANGAWHLHPQGNIPHGGNIDWKGWYVDGRPTRILTWNSGSGRYSAAASTTYGSEIYQLGRTLVVAPGPVLGAALQRDLAGNAWVIAICAIGDKDVAFARPATRDPSPARYDAQHAPQGWRYLGEFEPASELGPQRQPWLFNGDGTEAQTMRERSGREGLYTPAPLTRVKAVVDLTSARFSDLGNTEITHTYRSGLGTGCQSGNRDDAWQHAFVGEHVVAVDYADRAEVLARIEVDSLIDSHLSADFSENGEYTDLRGLSTSTEDTVWRLRIGSMETPVYEKHSAAQTRYTQISGNWTWDESQSAEQSRQHVSFWDFRDGYLFSVKGRAASRSSTHLENARTFVTNSTIAAQFVRQLAPPGQALADFNRTPLVERADTWNTSDEPYQRAHGNGTYRCHGQPDGPLPRGEASTPFTATFSTVPKVYYPANVDVFTHAAAATDRAGRFFWSLRYSNAPGQPYFRYSRIDGIPVDPITGLTNADPHLAPYFDIKPY